MDYLDIKELYHHGIKGQKWGIRRYQNEDGTLTEEGMARYRKEIDKMSEKEKVKTYLKDKHYIQSNYKKIGIITPTDKATISKIEKYHDDIDNKSKEAVDEYFRMTGGSRKEYEKKYGGTINDYGFARWIFEDDGYDDLLASKKDMSKIKKIEKELYDIINENITFQSKLITQDVLDKYYGNRIVEKAETSEKNRRVATSIIAAAGTMTLLGLASYLGSHSN